jgi:hypothetical protein
MQPLRRVQPIQSAADGIRLVSTPPICHNDLTYDDPAVRQAV